MDQNNLFTEDIPSVQLLSAHQDHNEDEDFAQNELTVIVQKKRQTFLTLIFVLILFVTVNVGYFLYHPDALASVVITIFFLNLAIFVSVCYVKKKKKVKHHSVVMSVFKDEETSNLQTDKQTQI